jgi:hypothetical protein
MGKLTFEIEEYQPNSLSDPSILRDAPQCSPGSYLNRRARRLSLQSL